MGQEVIVILNETNWKELLLKVVTKVFKIVSKK